MWYEEIDPDIEEMIMKGIRNHKIYVSVKNKKKIKYRAVSDLEQRKSLKKMVDAASEGNKEVLKIIFGDDKEEEPEIDKEGEKPKKKSVITRMIEINLNPVSYYNALEIKKLYVIYYGIKDFYPGLNSLSEEEAIEVISFFDPADINILSTTIENISIATEENKDKTTFFPARYAEK